jgi:hypothetical protein
MSLPGGAGQRADTEAAGQRIVGDAAPERVD